MFQLPLLTQLSGKELNKLNNYQPFYKLINNTKTHHNFTYSIGLNIDTHTFNPHDTCCSGGLYFTTQQFITRYLYFGLILNEIIIPDDALCCIENNKLKSNKIIVKNFTNIWESEFMNCKIFCKKIIQYNPNFMHYSLLKNKHQN